MKMTSDNSIIGTSERPVVRASCPHHLPAKQDHAGETPTPLAMNVFSARRESDNIKPMNTKPNILLITADQIRSDTLGCYGNQVCRTPNLDAIAAGGTVFEKGYSPNPVCVPARASITCGCHSLTCGQSQGGGGQIRDGQTKIAEHFRSHGYGAYACGKLHYAHYAPPGQPRLVHGFELGTRTNPAG